MDAESFFSRWSRRKAQSASGQTDKTADNAVGNAPAKSPEEREPEPLPPPTLEDVAALTPQSDFQRFFARGVDNDVRRAAMKKLFADPHFNRMDGLDIYIEDYNRFTPIPEAMLAALQHAQSVLNPEVPPDRSPANPSGIPDDQEPDDSGEEITTQADSAEQDGETTVPATAADDADTAIPEESPDHDDPIQSL